jgi:hypothetical protein
MGNLVIWSDEILKILEGDNPKKKSLGRDWKPDLPYYWLGR